MFLSEPPNGTHTPPCGPVIMRNVSAADAGWAANATTTAADAAIRNDFFMDILPVGPGGFIPLLPIGPGWEARARPSRVPAGADMP